MVGKVPKDVKINFRTHGSVRRKAQILPCTMEDIFKIGLEYASSEVDRLEYKKGELELEKDELEKKLTNINANITAINNRIRIIAPSRLDRETLSLMINQATMDYAKDVFDHYGKDSLDKLDNDEVLETAKDWGYDGEKFLELVEVQLKRKV